MSEREQEREPGSLILALPLPERHYLGIDRHNAGLNFTPRFIVNLRDIPDSKTICELPEGLQYLIDPQSLPEVFQLRLPNGKKDQPSPQDAAGVFLISKHSVGRGFDFEMTYRLPDGRLFRINPYVFLKLVGMGAFYKTSYASGDKAEHQHMVMPLPESETNRLGLFIAPAEYQMGGAAPFEAMLEEVIKQLVKLDENSEFGKAGFKEVLQKYRPFNGVKGLGLLTRKVVGKAIKADELEAQRDPLDRFLDGVQQMDIESLQQAAREFSVLLYQNPGTRGLLETQLAKTDFIPTVASQAVYPEELNQSAKEREQARLAGIAGGLSHELRGLNQKINGLEQDIKAKRNVEAALKKILAQTPDKQAELQRARQELAALETEIGQLKAEQARQQAQKRQLIADNQTALAELDHEIERQWQLVQAREGERTGVSGWLENPDAADFPFKPGVLVNFPFGKKEVVGDWYLVGFEPDTGRAVLLRYDAGDPRKYLRETTDFATLARLNKESYSLADISGAASLAELDFIAHHFQYKGERLTIDSSFLDTRTIPDKSIAAVIEAIRTKLLRLSKTDYPELYKSITAELKRQKTAPDKNLERDKKTEIETIASEAMAKFYRHERTELYKQPGDEIGKFEVYRDEFADQSCVNLTTGKGLFIIPTRDFIASLISGTYTANSMEEYNYIRCDLTPSSAGIIATRLAPVVDYLQIAGGALGLTKFDLAVIIDDYHRQLEAEGKSYSLAFIVNLRRNIVSAK